MNEDKDAAFQMEVTVRKMLEVKPELLGLYKEIQNTFNKEMKEINNNKDRLEYYDRIHPILKKWYSVIARINELELTIKLRRNEIY